MTVVVDGQCASSCANYIFTAGAQKVIRSGWVGFHGNLSAGMTVGQSYNRNSLKKEGLTEYEIEQNIINGQKGAIQEAAFLNELGVKQDLFDKSWLGGNGPTKSYEFLCPTPAAMERYGIMNVTGNQDLSATPQSLLEE